MTRSAEKYLYFLKILLIWIACIIVFFLSFEALVNLYEYSQKAALPRYVLKKLYFYQGLAAVFGFGLFFTWMYARYAKKMRDVLVKHNRIKVLEKFSAHVAHEIRNPLTSLSLNAELIQHSISKSTDPREVEINKICQGIIEDIGRLTKRTEYYLDFRDRSKNADVFEVNLALREVANSVKDEIKDKGINLDLNLKPERGLELRGSGKRFKLAVCCFLKNSIEAMPQGGTITIEGISKRKSFHLKLTDTGVGMTREVRQHLFEPFFTTKLKGAGLGLCLAYQIFEEFRAPIKFSSVVGGGTTFQIKFPLLTLEKVR